LAAWKTGATSALDKHLPGLHINQMTELNLAQGSDFWHQKAAEAGVTPSPQPSFPAVPTSAPVPAATAAQDFWKKQAQATEEAKTAQPMVMQEGNPPPEAQLEGPTTVARGMDDFWRQQSLKSKESGAVPKGKSVASVKKVERGRPTSSFNRLSDKERTEAYFEMYDRTIQLQKSHTIMEQRMKELTVKLERTGASAKHERKFGEQVTGLDFKASALPGDGEVGRLKAQNSQLKQRMERVSMAIKSGKVKGNRKYSPEGPTVAGTTVRPKVLVSLLPEDSQKEQMIEKLRAQLMLTEKELIRVRTGTAPLTDGSLRATNLSMVDMEGKQQDMEEKLDAQRLYLDQVMKRLEATQAQLTEERIRSAQLEQRVRTYEMATTGAGDMVQKLDELTQENRRLEAQIRDLCSSPFIKEAGDRLGLQSRMSNYENELRTNGANAVKYKESVLKLESELAKTREEFRMQSEQAIKSREELAMMRTRLEERERYIADINAKLNMIGGGSDMTEFFRVLGIAKLKTEESLDGRLTFLNSTVLAPPDPPSQLRAIEQLKLEKAQLAAELEKFQSLLTLREQMEKEKVALVQTEAEYAKAETKGLQLRVEELSRLADYRATRLGQVEARGRPSVYEESEARQVPRPAMDSDFVSDEASELGPGENALELLVIGAEFYESALSQLLGGLTRIEPGILTLLTIDFYNHETQSTGLSDGLKPGYNTLIAFRATMDEFFIRHIEKEAMSLEAHINTGKAHTTFAKGKVVLSELLQGKPVDSMAVLLSLDGKTSVGTVHYKMRLRNPVAEMMRFVKPAAPLKPADVQPVRKLVITVFKCSGLIGSGTGAQLAPFIYYQFYSDKEVFTAVKAGPDPVIDEVHIHEVKMDAAARNFLDQEALEIVVFDDKAPIRAGGQDIIGMVHIPLNPLLLDTAIEGNFSLYNSQGRQSGVLVMRITWQDSRVESLGYGTPLTKVWEREVFERIASNLLNRELTLEAAFNIFDQDQDGQISASEFRNTVLMTLRLPISDQEVSLLVNSFSSTDGSLTREEFYNKFAGLLPSALGPAVMWEEAVIEKVRSRIRDKNLDLKSAFDAFDIDKSGFIDRNEFIRTLKVMQLGLTDEDIDKLLRYFDPRDIGRIYFQTFHDKMTADTGSSAPRSSKPTRLSAKEVQNRMAGMLRESSALVQAFQTVDRPGSGKVTRDEFGKALQVVNLGLSYDEISALWEDLPKDAGSRADYRAFCQRFDRPLSDPTRPLSGTSSLAKSVPLPTLGEVRQKVISTLRSSARSPLAVFQANDTNHDNFLTLPEFSAALAALKLSLTEAEITVLVTAADPRRESRISIEEWIRLLDPRGSPMDAFKRLARDSRLSLKDIFLSFDQNGDGTITAVEFQNAMQRLNLGLTMDEIGQLIAQMDKNRDGKISYNELLTTLEPPKASIPQSTPTPDPNQQTDSLKEVVTAIAGSGLDLASAFKVFDKNGDGFISREEFGKVFSDMKLGLTRDQIGKLQDRVDKNRDGKISYLEFKALFAAYGIVVQESRMGTSSSTQSMAAKKRPMRSVQEIYRLLDEYMRNQGLNILKFYRQHLDSSNTTLLSKDELTRGLNAVLTPALVEGEIAALMNELCGPGATRFNFGAFKASFTRFSNMQSATVDQSRRQQLLEASESLSSSYRQSFTEARKK